MKHTTRDRYFVTRSGSLWLVVCAANRKTVWASASKDSAMARCVSLVRFTAACVFVSL